MNAEEQRITPSRDQPRKDQGNFAACPQRRQTEQNNKMNNKLASGDFTLTAQKKQ